MRSTPLLLFLLTSLSAHAQQNVWRHVSPSYNQPVLETQTTLPIARQLAIARLIRHCCASDLNTQPGSTAADAAQCLTFQAIPLAPKQNVLLVWGCSQAGTGGGGASVQRRPMQNSSRR